LLDKTNIAGTGVAKLSDARLFFLKYFLLLAPS
jgi:hypothetical protein